MPETSLYDKLSTHTKAFMAAMSPATPGTNDLDLAKIRTFLSPDAHVSWGHDLFVSTKPPLQGEKSRQGFLDHMAKMTPNLKTFRIETRAMCVDVEQKSVVVRADFFMTAKEAVEPVVNDILFWLVFDGEGERIVDSVEFIDPVAGGELAKKIQASKETGDAPI